MIVFLFQSIKPHSPLIKFRKGSTPAPVVFQAPVVAATKPKPPTQQQQQQQQQPQQRLAGVQVPIFTIQCCDVFLFDQNEGCFFSTITVRVIISYPNL